MAFDRDPHRRRTGPRPRRPPRRSASPSNRLNLLADDRSPTMAPASEPDDLARQFDLIRQALTLLHPGARLRRVTIEFVGGADPFVAPMRGSVPGCDDVPPPARPLFEQPAPKARPAEEIEELTPMQLEILNVIDHMTDGETLSADAIANRAGYGPIASGPARDFISQVAPLNGLKRGPRGWVRPTQ